MDPPFFTLTHTIPESAILEFHEQVSERLITADVFTCIQFM